MVLKLYCCTFLDTFQPFNPFDPWPRIDSLVSIGAYPNGAQPGALFPLVYGMSPPTTSAALLWHPPLSLLPNNDPAVQLGWRGRTASGVSLLP